MGANADYFGWESVAANRSSHNLTAAQRGAVIRGSVVT